MAGLTTRTRKATDATKERFARRRTTLSSANAVTDMLFPSKRATDILSSETQT